MTHSTSPLQIALTITDWYDNVLSKRQQLSQEAFILSLIFAEAWIETLLYISPAEEKERWLTLKSHIAIVLNPFRAHSTLYAEYNQGRLLLHCNTKKCLGINAYTTHATIRRKTRQLIAQPLDQLDEMQCIWQLVKFGQYAQHINLLTPESWEAYFYDGHYLYAHFETAIEQLCDRIQVLILSKYAPRPTMTFSHAHATQKHSSPSPDAQRSDDACCLSPHK